MNRTVKKLHQPLFELSPIKAMEIAASKIPGSISLAQGIPSFQTPPEIKEFVYEKIKQGLCDKYSLPMGLSELREEIALSFQKDSISYDPEKELLITVGSIAGIASTLMALTEPGDEILLPSPTYSSYLGSIHMARCQPKFFELDEERGFDFDIEQIRRSITKNTRLLLYCTPNNPTGTLYSEELTREMIKLAEEHNLYVLVDEVYKDFYYSGEAHFSPAQIPSSHSRLIRVCSFSKAYAMTGWRVGFVAAQANLTAQILKYHDAFANCAPVVSQYAAIAALRHGDEFLKSFVEAYRLRRDYTIERLDHLSLYLDYQIPRATYFVFPRLKDSIPLSRDSTRFSYRLLEQAGVAVVPGVAFGPSGESHIRINFGRDQRDLEVGFDRISDFLFKREIKSFDSAKPTLPSSRSADKRSQQQTPSLGYLLTESILCKSARTYLRRNKPVIIGIAGVRGKTFLKRSLVELLEHEKKIRGNILSYNTTVGLPLAILMMEAPKTLTSKVLFPLKLIFKTLLSREQAEIIVLEYGIGSEREAKLLLDVAPPDWLLLSSLGSEDPYVRRDEMLAGLRIFCSQVPSGQILYSAEEPLIQTVLEDPDKAIKLIRPDLAKKVVTFESKSYPYRRECVGKSAQLGLVASVALAERLQIASTSIYRYLGDNQ